MVRKGKDVLRKKHLRFGGPTQGGANEKASLGKKERQDLVSKPLPWARKRREKFH